MVDDRKKRQVSHWDGEKRALWGRGRTEPGAQAVPVEVDPELTPPPAAPPQPADFERMSQAEQLRALRSHAETNQTALAAVWPARHVADELANVKRAVDGYSRQVDRHQQSLGDFVLPAIRTQMGRVTALEQQQTESIARLRVFFDTEWPRHTELMERISGSLKDITERIGRIEARQDKFADSITTHEARLSATEREINAIDVRVTALERHNADARLVATTTTTERKRIFTMARVSLATVFTAVGMLASQLPRLIEWLNR